MGDLSFALRTKEGQSVLVPAVSYMPLILSNPQVKVACFTVASSGFLQEQSLRIENKWKQKNLTTYQVGSISIQGKKSTSKDFKIQYCACTSPWDVI